jgi:phospholipase D1/2
MAGSPFKVGRFAHTLRVRLMQEHLGVDVDSIWDDEFGTSQYVKPDRERGERNFDAEQMHEKDMGVMETKQGTMVDSFEPTATSGIQEGQYYADPAIRA